MSNATTNLEELRDQLIKELQNLNQNFVELFNNNYDQFFQLSFIISQLERPLDKITQPLEVYKDELVKLCKQFDDYIATIDDKQDQLIETCKHKHIVARFIQLVKRRDQLERAFEDVDWTVGTQTNNQQQTRNILQFDLLERVNVELYYLSKELEIIQPIDELYHIRKHVEASLSSRQKQLDTWFESAFLEAVDLDNNFHIDLVVRTYEQKDAIQKLDSVFRNNVVRPYLSKLISDSNVMKDSTNLDTLFKQIEQFIESKTSLIRCDFAKKCCWQETLDLMERLTTLYSLENLELFKKRHAGTLVFLKRNNLDETQCKQVLDRFNLKSYLQQRTYQIITGVEESLSKDPLKQISEAADEKEKEVVKDVDLLAESRDTSTATKATSSSDTTNNNVVKYYNLKVTNDIHQWIAICWSDDIYIPELDMDFHKIVCQILNRFALWLSRLRLSDFKNQGQIGQTNFLAVHKALMSLLMKDCDLLTRFIEKLPSSSPLELLHGRTVASQTVENGGSSGTGDTSADISGDIVNTTRELYNESFSQIKKGLANVHSLQKLIEK